MQAISAKKQLAVLTRVFLRVLMPVTIGVLVIFALALWKEIPISDLLRDTSATLDGDSYVGLFSTLGIALWAATTAICILALRSAPPSEAKALLTAGAVASLILGIDDAFLIHETAKGVLGIPSPLTIGTYGVIALVLFFRARGDLLSRENLSVFLAAVLLFAISVVLDAAGEADLPTPPYSAIIEDFAKFIGIVTWLVFFAAVARDATTRDSRLESTPSSGAG